MLCQYEITSQKGEFPLHSLKQQLVRALNWEGNFQTHKICHLMQKRVFLAQSIVIPLSPCLSVMKHGYCEIASSQRCDKEAMGKCWQLSECLGVEGHGLAACPVLPAEAWPKASRNQVWDMDTQGGGYPCCAGPGRDSCVIHGGW